MINQIRRAIARKLAGTPDEGQIFLERFDQHASNVIELLESIYGERDDFAAHMDAIFHTAVDAYLERSEGLKVLDNRREEHPDWYQHHGMMAAMCYVDLFADDLQGIRDSIPYFRELGLTYLHLMPLFKTPDGPDDGGYAVSSYREVADDLGTIEDLRLLAAELKMEGISLALDFVFNHTADDHMWAQRAKAGDPRYQDYYYLFDDRTIPDQYEPHLREIFPDEHPGAFTYDEEAEKWVWTTFHRYQWDLKYANPAVFRQMLEEMLFLANLGVDVLRLDAVAFIWKEIGTNCENLPEAHTIIRAYNQLVRMAAPSMIFKSEAIVHPDEVVQYLGTGEGIGQEAEIGYNPLLMVELWEALATQHTHLLTYSMEHRFEDNPPNTAWVNYVRSHDDIGWGFADEDAAELHIDGFAHRQYLNRFYTGQEPDSFARGLPFQYNPKTEDMRISGTTASLAGLEAALEEGDEHAVEMAIRRILLMQSVVLSMGGIPLIYLGDEIAMLNDYSYEDDPTKAHDSRWVHRPPFDWERAEKRHDPESIPGRVFLPLKKMISLRKEHPAFGAASDTEILHQENMHTYVYRKSAGDDRVLCVTNFSPNPQTVPLEGLYRDLISGEVVEAAVELPPYTYMWLTATDQPSS